MVIYSSSSPCPFSTSEQSGAGFRLGPCGVLYAQPILEGQVSSGMDTSPIPYKEINGQLL